MECNEEINQEINQEINNNNLLCNSEDTLM